jgi:hypothetical protein
MRPVSNTEKQDAKNRSHNGGRTRNVVFQEAADQPRDYRGDPKSPQVFRHRF